MSVEHHDRPNTVTVQDDQRSVDLVDQPITVEVSEDNVNVTVSTAVGASGLGSMAYQDADAVAITGGYVADVSEEVTCTNRTGSPIGIGKAVYLIGAHGDMPEIALADASTEATAARTLGITAEAIAHNGTGRVCFSGLLEGINTNTLTEGALVWLSETAGELTTTRPTQPAHGVFLGLVVKQAPGGAGILFVSVVNGQELDELHDVLITSPTAGQLFKRNTGNTLWVNASPGALTKTDDTNVTLTLGGSPSAALVNDASLTLGWTGQLGVTRGGTGASSLTGYVKGNGVSAMTAASTIPSSDITGLGTMSTQNATSVAITGGTISGIADLAVADGGTGASTAQAAMNTFAGAVTSGQYLRGNGSNVVMSAIQAADVPTLNQNTTGTAAGLSQTLAVSSGGTGTTSLTGYLVGNGSSAFTAVASIPGSAISGNITGNAANVTGTVAVGNGGTGVTSLSGYVFGNGGSAFTAVSSIPGSVISGNISGNAANVTGTVAVGNGGTGTTSLTGYLVGNGSSAFTAVSSIPGSAISGNIAGNAANVTGLVAVTNGGTGVGSLTGLVKGNGTSAFTAATSGVDYAPATSGTAILYGDGSGGFSAVSIGANLSFTGGTLSATGGGGGGGVTAVTASAPLASSGGATPDISFTGTLAIANGGTGQTTAVNAFDALAPTTTLGDVIYHNGTDNVRLAGQTTTTRNFLRQTGTGSLSAAPAWDTVTKTDVGLSNVENTALSTWAGSGNLTTTGTIRPTANDGAALGVSGTAYSDLYLASGAVVDFNAGDVTITHSAASSGGLTFAGASNGFAFTNGNVTVSENVALASTKRIYVDGTAATGDTYLVESAANTLDLVAGGVTAISTTGTLTTFGTATVRPAANDGAALGASGTAWADLFLASGGVVNWAAGDVTLTHATDELRLAGGANGYFHDAPLSTAATWTSRTSAADNQWADIAYGNGIFVAVGYSGTGNRVMTSPDGVKWTTRTSAADNSWFGLTYGNGLFVAVAASGTGNRVMTSPDGITWTARSSAADNAWDSVVWGNGLFVAVGYTGTGNRVMTSPDGITWTTRTPSVDNQWRSVTYGNGLFVAVATSGTGDGVMTSPDGITWTTRTSAADEQWRGVAYGNGLFVAVANSGVSRVMTSPDGITWTLRTPPANEWLAITYGNGLFVATAASGTNNRVMTSRDGITWTSRTSAADNSWAAVAYGNGIFVAVSATGTGNRVMTSGWTERTLTATNNYYNGPTTFTGSVTAPSLLSLANDSGALGASGTAWSDLFLASGAVVNFNAGDVTITHAADTLTFGGATTGYVFNDGPITNALGAAATPSYTFTGDLDTGVWSSAGNVINFSTGGTERARITANGRLLVGLTTENMGIPVNVLRAIGVVNFSDSVPPEWYLRRTHGTESAPTAIATNTELGNIFFQGYGGTNYRSLGRILVQCTTYTSDSNITAAMRFYTTNAGSSPSERLRISGAGDVAIISGAKLLLDGVAATGDTYLTETSANNIAIFTGGSERLRLDGSGNVGVNVTTFGTSAAGVLGLKNGTEPTTGPADTVQVYSVDRSAGNTIPAIYCEGTGVTDAGITSTTVTHKIALKVNGTVYYLLATTNAT